MSTKKIFIASLLFVSILVAPASATMLSDLFGSAISGSTGSVAYSSGNLTGNIHYGAFHQGAFNSNFSASTVSVGAGEVAYVYQIENTGTDAVSENRIVGLNASVTGIGHADINAGGTGEVAPTSESLTTFAQWEFQPAANNILQNENSSALVIRSTNLPDGTTTDVIFNGGGIALTQVIAPGETAVPEPGAALLLSLGSALLFARRSREGS